MRALCQFLTLGAVIIARAPRDGASYLFIDKGTFLNFYTLPIEN